MTSDTGYWTLIDDGEDHDASVTYGGDGVTINNAPIYFNRYPIYSGHCIKFTYISSDDLFILLDSKLTYIVDSVDIVYFSNTHEWAIDNLIVYRLYDGDEVKITYETNKCNVYVNNNYVGSSSILVNGGFFRIMTSGILQFKDFKLL